VKLTARNIQTLSLPSGKVDHIEPDDQVPGFGVRMRAGGSKTWIFQYKVGSQQRRISLGAVSAIDVGRARASAGDLYARVRLGADPAADRMDARSKAAETFIAVANRFLAYKRLRVRASTLAELERHITRDAKPLHPLQIEKIARRDVAACLAAVLENSGPVASNRVRAALNGLFVWGMGLGVLESNPIVGTLRHAERSRDRVLAPQELAAVWHAASDGSHFGSIVRLLMLTGQRANEIAALTWSEVDVNKGFVALSGARTKNHRAHQVWLSHPARAIIAAQPRRVLPSGQPRDLIFGVSDAGGFSGWSSAKKKLDARIAQATGKELPHWTVHDLRRSLSTHACEIGIAPHIVEGILNHYSGHRRGTSGVYNRATYAEPARVALDRWADQLMTWVGGTNVVQLRA
jgi:integrase